MAEQQDERAVPMEGRSRGPNIHSGGTQDIGTSTPPYEGRSVGDETDKRGRTDHDAGSRQVSQEEREGVPPEDTTAASPHGAGVSTGTQGNEQMVGESKEAHRKDREESTYSGVGSSTPVDPESPNLSPGDQGG